MYPSKQCQTPQLSHHLVDGYHSQLESTRTDMDTSMKVTAEPPPSQWAERVSGFDHTCSCCCRASGGDHVVFSLGPARLPVLALTLSRFLRSPCLKPPTTGTGTTGTGTGEAPAALAATPDAPARGPEARSAAAESPATTIGQAAKSCGPVRATSGRTTTGKPSLL